MEGFMNLAKQGLQKYEESQRQSQGGNQGGQSQGGYQGGESQQYGGQGQSQEYQGGGGQGGGNVQGGPQYNNTPGAPPQINHQAALSAATENGGSQEDAGLFQQGLHAAQSFGQNNHQAPQNIQVDEQGLQNAHSQAYSQGNAGNMDASSMGAAAAMQAMKKFMGNSSGGQGGSSGGMDMNKIIGLAMSEASQLFDKSGGAASGNKGDAISSASTTIIQLLMKSKMSGSTGTGGLGGLMSMASKFM